MNEDDIDGAAGSDGANAKANGATRRDRPGGSRAASARDTRHEDGLARAAPAGADGMDEERDAFLSAALRHAPDADLAAPAGISDAILRQARSAAAGTTVPAAPRRASPWWSGIGAFWGWLGRPAVASGLASMIGAALIGLLWWDRPIEPTLPRPDAPVASIERAPVPQPGPAERPSGAATPAEPVRRELDEPATRSGSPALPAPMARTAPPPPARPAAPAMPARGPEPDAATGATAPRPRPSALDERRATIAGRDAAASGDSDVAPREVAPPGGYDAPPPQRSQLQSKTGPPAQPKSPPPAAPALQRTPEGDDAAARPPVAATSRVPAPAAIESFAARRGVPAQAPVPPPAPAPSSPPARPPDATSGAMQSRLPDVRMAAPEAAAARAEGESRARAEQLDAAPRPSAQRDGLAATAGPLSARIGAEPQRWTWRSDDGPAQPMTAAVAGWVARFERAASRWKDDPDTAAHATGTPPAASDARAGRTIHLMFDGRAAATLVLGDRGGSIEHGAPASRRSGPLPADEVERLRAGAPPALR